MRQRPAIFELPGRSLLFIALALVFLLFTAPAVLAEEETTQDPAPEEAAETPAPEEKADTASSYLECKDAVFLVNQAVFLDGSLAKHPDLFKKLEKAMGKPLLNQYIPISNGTAFLINDKGFLVTAFHVVKVIPVSRKKVGAQWSFLNYVAKNILPGVLTRYELNLIIKDYLRIAGQSDVYITVKGTDKKEYPARILDQKENLDLALLKINLNGGYNTIPVRDNADLTVGAAVVTIGYPLTFIMDQFLDDFKPTITNGIISALRSDMWDIQHTASINPGNSGGPLLSPQGDLVGVNVGTLNNANNIYFAINVKKLTSWLKEIGRGEFIQHENE